MLKFGIKLSGHTIRSMILLEMVLKRKHGVDIGLLSVHEDVYPLSLPEFFLYRNLEWHEMSLLEVFYCDFWR